MTYISLPAMRAVYAKCAMIFTNEKNIYIYSIIISSGSHVITPLGIKQSFDIVIETGYIIEERNTRTFSETADDCVFILAHNEVKHE